MLSMASTTAATPIDRDLQELYNEVWAGYTGTEELDTPSTAVESDGPYNTYGENGCASTPSTAISPSSMSHFMRSSDDLNITN